MRELLPDMPKKAEPRTLSFANYTKEYDAFRPDQGLEAPISHRIKWWCTLGLSVTWIVFVGHSAPHQSAYVLLFPPYSLSLSIFISRSLSLSHVYIYIQCISSLSLLPSLSHSRSLHVRIKNKWKYLHIGLYILVEIRAHTYSATYIHTCIHTYMPALQRRNPWKPGGSGPT